MAITAKVEKITPEIAKEYLKMNSRNPRKRMDWSTINKYASDIAAGLWTLNGEAIIFDEDGYLVNGQHRLCGVVKANVPFQTLVVRGVARGITNYDGQLRRTVTQNVNARSNVSVNSHISSAAKLIVNNFGAPKGQGMIEDYILNHVDELERAWRIACHGGTGTMKSKCGSCIAAAYLALRTESIPHYELELFFRRFNGIDTWDLGGYDISAALIARQMFDERGTAARTGLQIQKEKLEIIVMAMQDFHNSVHVTEKYRIAEPFHFSEWMNEGRGKDGVD